MGKVDRVKRLKVIQDHFNGGLGMIDIESLITSFKASWLHRIKQELPEANHRARRSAQGKT